ncbi:MAG: glycosyl hydrolase family 65 protein [Armatimonadota bacterium]
MFRFVQLLGAILVISFTLLTNVGECNMDIPEDFPRYQVPGFESEMDTLRHLYWIHYPQSGAKSTMWDVWLPTPSLWPAVETDNHMNNLKNSWKHMLSIRPISDEGYVSVMQHDSIAHPEGWPFPFYNQAFRVFAYHYTFKHTTGHPWSSFGISNPSDFPIENAESKGVDEEGWTIELTGPNATITYPKMNNEYTDRINSPFLQVRWASKDLQDANPYIEWITEEEKEYSIDRRFYFSPIDSETIVRSTIPMYKHPKWDGKITGIRLGFGNKTNGKVLLGAIFSVFDTRHNINSQSYIIGCTSYFNLTGDINFLRNNINRIRKAMQFVMTEHQALERKYVFTDWVGHEGRPGIRYNEDGKKELIYGNGIGNNYWDLMPFGYMDCYATMLYYAALLRMADLEQAIIDNPQWNIPSYPFTMTPKELRKHALEVKKVGNEMFWNKETGRFVPGIDIDGNMHDYGYTFLNLEAIYYDFANEEHAKSIMSWINGDRIVDGDTSQGKDIYKWRFSPRASTKRNTIYYVWVWSDPESIPFGGQVQDGGAVLGFTHHDLMSRLKILGADNAWQRLSEIIDWYKEVKNAGGYREYYKGNKEATLQGGGTAGGLGIDAEFYESVMATQVVIEGFLGFTAKPDGISINPNLPSNWPELKIDRIRFRNLILEVSVKENIIEIKYLGDSNYNYAVYLPKGKWKVQYISKDGSIKDSDVKVDVNNKYLPNWIESKGFRFIKEN